MRTMTHERPSEAWAFTSGCAKCDGKQKEIIEKQKSEVEQQTDVSVKLEVPKKEENELKLELKDVGSGVDEEEKLSARARKIYLMKELFGDDSVVDEVRSSRSSTLLLLHFQS